MAWNVVVLSYASRGLAPRVRAFAPLLVVLAVSGCETLERMDYLDRFFEPASQPAPVVAVEPRPDPAPDWRVQPGTVVAMEPRPNPPSSPAADWNAQPGAVVAMEPRPNPPASPAVDGNMQASRARAVEPRADPAPAPETDPGTDVESRTRLLVRQNQWLTRFWMELTAAQQARVERQLRRGDVVLAAGNAEPAVAWDSMGLSDRARLIFGSGQPMERPAPSDKRDGSNWARTS